MFNNMNENDAFNYNTTKKVHQFCKCTILMVVHIIRKKIQNEIIKRWKHKI